MAVLAFAAIAGAGLAAASFFLRPSGPSIEGPRLNDLSVTSSAYGDPIPLLFGTMRIGGQLIWATDIEEIQGRARGGKGGGGASGNTYEYFGNFAIGFCEGEMEDVTRMWADGKLIYDKTERQVPDGQGGFLSQLSDFVQKEGLNFRFYPGSESQQPDSLIESVEGVNSTPAFRGLCYIVFDRLPLKDFGNRIPNITAEITSNASDNRPVQQMDFFTTGEGGLTTSFQINEVFPDFDRGLIYAIDSSGTIGENVLRRFNMRTMTEDRQMAYSEDAFGNDALFMNLIGVAPSGEIILENRKSTFPSAESINVVDPNSLEIVSGFGGNQQQLFSSPTQLETAGIGKSSFIQILGLNGLNTYILVGSLFNSVGLLRINQNELEYIWDSDSAQIGLTSFPIANNERVLGTCGGIVEQGFGEGYVMAGAIEDGLGNTEVINFYRIRVGLASGYDPITETHFGVDVDLIASLEPDDLVSGETVAFDRKGLIYDEIDDTIMFQAEVGSSSDAYMFKLDPRTGEILWRTSISFNRNQLAGMNYARMPNGIYAQLNSSQPSFVLRTSSGEIFDTPTGWSPANSTAGAEFWDGKSSSVFGVSTAPGGINKYQFFRGEGGGSSLDTIVTSICNRVGLENTDLDVTSLSGSSVPGYSVSKKSTARAAIEPLTSIFFFDGVESDYLLKFVDRDNKSVSLTIPDRDLAFINEQDGDIIDEERMDDVDLPLRLTITYFDKDRDHQEGAQDAKRPRNPTLTMQSFDEVDVEVPAVMEADFVKQAAEKGLYSAWIGRDKYRVLTSWEYLTLDPSDLINIELDSGVTFRTRITDQGIGANLNIELDSISEDAAQYTSTTLGDTGFVPSQEFLAETITKLILLCSPLLRDADDVGRVVSRLYFFMGGYGQPGWQAGTLFKSIDNTEFDQVGVTTNEMSWGTAANILGNTTAPFQTDEINTLRIFMNTGADNLSSITQAQMLNGGNAAALIHSNGVDVELINFRDVTVNDDGSRTLSGLLRGRRGTDVFTDNHSVGDTFILLSDTTGGILDLSLGERDQSRFYRPVTTGQILESAISDSKASPANDLKPYAPVQQEAVLEVNDDITLTWVRRTRIGGELQGGTGTVPLSEDSELYDLEILDGPDGSVVRTETDLTSPTYLYTSGNQTTDGFTPPLTEITIRVYQKSAQVGRGFTNEVTLNVQ